MEGYLVPIVAVVLLLAGAAAAGGLAVALALQLRQPCRRVRYLWRQSRARRRA